MPRNLRYQNCILGTYLITPWNIVHLEKLTDSQLVKKFLAYYGTHRFITAFTSAQLPVTILSQIDPVHIPTSHFLKIHLNIILPSNPGSSMWTLSLTPSHQIPVCTSPLPHTCYIPHPPHSSRFDHPNTSGRGVQIIKLLIM